MPAIQNLVLADRASPAVNHTFGPVTIDSKTGIGVLAEQTAVPIGNPTYTIDRRMTQSGRYRIRANLKVPVIQTETVNGIARPVEVRAAHASIELSFSNQSTEQERKDAVGMLADSLAAAKWTNGVFVNLEGVY